MFTILIFDIIRILITAEMHIMQGYKKIKATLDFSMFDRGNLTNING